MASDLRLAARLLFWLGFCFLASPVVIGMVKVTARLIVTYE